MQVHIELRCHVAIEDRVDILEVDSSCVLVRLGWKWVGLVEATSHCYALGLQESPLSEGGSHEQGIHF